MDTYKIEFFTFEDLVKDFLALSSFLGRTPAVVIYRYKDYLYTMHPFYEGVGIHFCKDPEKTYPSGEYIFDTLTEKIKQKLDKKELSANEVLIIIIEQKYNSILEGSE
ncbi:MAG: hypothetical protein ACP5LX_02260 [Nitrososphaeria archaeon]|jgi:hypothetical protein